MSNTEKTNIAISIKNLKITFGEQTVLEGLSFDLSKGKNLAVLGRSGSGKSVLIKIISGLLKPDSGTVNVLGFDINKINKVELRELRTKIGFSFQSSALYDSMSVMENLAFPLTRNQRHLSKTEVNLAIEEALDDVGLPQTLHQMPAELSGGQRKRIGIARTLILNPEIMLYDEPTAGLDPITSNEIIGLINNVQLKYKTSSIIITHDLTCAKNTAETVAILGGGKFLLRGSFDEVFGSEDPTAKSFFDYNFINEK